MVCTRCHQETKVMNSYRKPTHVKRRRICMSCGTKFVTYEIPVQETTEDNDTNESRELAEVRKKAETAIRIMTDIIEDIEEGAPAARVPARQTGQANPEQIRGRLPAPRLPTP